ncbi:twin-arginine translocation signal domain-containing protein [Dissulfurispira sp.]
MISRRNFLKAVAAGIAAVHPLKNAMASQKNCS